jgi:S-adenosylmethionine hydrolase
MDGTLPDAVEIAPDQIAGADWPQDLAKVCYVDRYGNLISGVRASKVDASAALAIAGRRIPNARTFSEVSVGSPFWFRNAFGLLELAVNQGRADAALGLAPGDALPLPGLL